MSEKLKWIQLHRHVYGLEYIRIAYAKEGQLEVEVNQT